MCLGVPGRVIEVNGLTAAVEFWGVKRQVHLETVDEPVKPGDYVLIHVGFAIRRIPKEEVEETLALYDELIKAEEKDLMAGDVRAEMDAAGSEHPASPVQARGVGASEDVKHRTGPH